MERSGVRLAVGGHLRHQAMLGMRLSLPLASIGPGLRCRGVRRHPEDEVFWCPDHYAELPSEESATAVRMPWHSALERALELERELEQDL